MTVYNEIEPYAVKWLGNLIQAGHIANGQVEERSICELRPADVEATQFHAFAGLGGWSYALRLAGWPDDRPVWTGSCPCQPFSGAGKRGGFKDKRHLWPEWFRLIKKCRPPVIFGEQVANPDGLKWFDLVSSDLERAGYVVGAADLCAAGVGAPHIRQRLYFVAVANSQRHKGLSLQLSKRQSQRAVSEVGRGGQNGVMGDARRERGGRDARTISRSQRESKSEWVAVGDFADEFESTGTINDLANPRSEGSQERSRSQKRPGTVRFQGSTIAENRLSNELANSDLFTGEQSNSFEQRRNQRGDESPRSRPSSSFWSDAEWLPCLDGKSRPVESGSHPLAYGVSNRVGRLRAYGNAIVPEIAATFIQAFMEER